MGYMICKHYDIMTVPSKVQSLVAQYRGIGYTVVDISSTGFYYILDDNTVIKVYYNPSRECFYEEVVYAK